MIKVLRIPSYQCLPPISDADLTLDSAAMNKQTFQSHYQKTAQNKMYDFVVFRNERFNKTTFLESFIQDQTGFLLQKLQLSL